MSTAVSRGAVRAVYTTRAHRSFAVPVLLEVDGLSGLSERTRSGRPIDRLMLVVLITCVVVAVVRVAAVVATVPYAFVVDRRAASEARAAGRPAPDVRITERVANSGPFESWWGGRRVPYREGGDYLGVITHHSASRALGCIIGTLVERDRAAGIRFERVILPSSAEVLYGVEAGTPMVRADGTPFRSYWAPPARDAAYFTDIPFAEAEYDPLLSDADIEKLGSLTERTESVFFAPPAPSGSGAWVLHVRQGEKREFLLVPVESSPQGGSL